MLRPSGGEKCRLGCYLTRLVAGFMIGRNDSGAGRTPHSASPRLMSITSRRNFVFHSAAAMFAARSATGAEPFGVTSYAEEFPDMLLAYLGGRLKELDDR